MNDNERAAQVASEAAGNIRRAVNGLAEQVERHSLNQEGFLFRFQHMLAEFEQLVERAEQVTLGQAQTNVDHDCTHFQKKATE